MQTVFLATEHHGEHAVFGTLEGAFEFIVDASFGSLDDDETPTLASVVMAVAPYGYWGDGITGECSIERLIVDNP